jgi:prepilin-type N-terminal cleavage/methylation domain-containing protein
MNSYRNQKGLTLLEILVAIVILSVILGVIYGSFLGATRTASLLETSEDAYQTAQAFFDMLSRELRGAYYREGRTIYFLTTSSGRREPNSREEDLAEVGYFFDVDEISGEKHLIKTIDRTPDADLLEGGTYYPLSDRVESLQFSYFRAKEGEWLDEWKNAYLPDLIRVELAILDDRGNTIHFRTVIQPLLMRGSKIKKNTI